LKSTLTSQPRGGAFDLENAKYRDMCPSPLLFLFPLGWRHNLLHEKKFNHGMKGGIVNTEEEETI
jgi:hypothetical protein